MLDSSSFSPARAPAPATYTLSLHDALPILAALLGGDAELARRRAAQLHPRQAGPHHVVGVPAVDHRVAEPVGHERRSEEHTSELQSRENLVCRLLLEKKKKREGPAQPTRTR